jgi:proteasome lid subunit RPN8/RPN11
MTGPGFTVEAIEQDVPFRDRALFGPCHQFADPGGTAVIVGGETASRLREAAAREQPRETGGLLHGRVLRDSAGRYAFVTGFVQAPPGTGDQGRFLMSPQATALLRAEAARRQPTADVIGWWHSHAQPSDYSGTDRSTQAMWTQSESVGLLVFATGKPWAHAYLGPRARRVPLQASAAWADRQRAHSAGEAAERSRLSWPAGEHPPARRPLPRPGAILAVAIVVISVAIVSWWLRDLAGAVNYGAAQLARMRQPVAVAASSSPPASASWSCVQRSPHTFECATPAPGAGVSVQWLLNGEPCGQQPSVLVRLPADSAESVIQLQARVATTVYDLGTQVLTG